MVGTLKMMGKFRVWGDKMPQVLCTLSQQTLVGSNNEFIQHL